MDIIKMGLNCPVPVHHLLEFNLQTMNSLMYPRILSREHSSGKSLLNRPEYHATTYSTLSATFIAYLRIYLGHVGRQAQSGSAFKWWRTMPEEAHSYVKRFTY